MKTGMSVFGIIFHPWRTRQELRKLREALSAATAAAEQSGRDAEIARSNAGQALRRADGLQESLDSLRAEMARRELEAAKEIAERDAKIEIISARLRDSDTALAVQQEQIDTVARQFKQMMDAHERYKKKIALLRGQLEQAKKRLSDRRAVKDEDIVPVNLRPRGFYQSSAPPVSPPKREATFPAAAEDDWYKPLDI